MNKIHSVAYLTLICAIVLLGFKSCDKTKEIVQLPNDSEVQVLVNRLGEEEAKTRTMQNVIRLKDAQILKLSKHTETATAIQIVTRDTGSTKTVVTYKDSLPTYTTEFCDTNVCGTITANKDSITRSIKVFNHILIKQEWQRERWYKSRELFTEVTNSNPYTNTIKIVSYKKQPKQRKYIVIGALFVGFIGGILSTR